MAVPFPSASQCSLASSPVPVPATTLFGNVVRQQLQTREVREAELQAVAGISWAGRMSRKDRCSWQRIASDVAEVDDYVLEGGLERGIVCGISGNLADGTGRLLSFHLIATSLLESRTCRCTVIDSVGTFPVLLLSQVLHHRISLNVAAERRRRQNQRSAGRPVDMADLVEEESPDRVQQRVKECLKRVSIERVFDIEGLWEVVGETRRTESDETTSTDTMESIQEDVILSQALHPSQNIRGPSEVQDSHNATEIQDSEDEDGDGDGDNDGDDEDALPIQESSTSAAENTLIPEVAAIIQKDTLPLLTDEKPIAETDMVLVDNMNTIITNLFSHHERASAHNLLDSLSRALRSLARTCNLSILLLNSLTTPRPHPPPPDSNASGPHVSESHRVQHPNVSSSTRQGASVFASTKQRPALGKVFDNLCDLHLMLTSIPLRRSDAELYFQKDRPGIDARSHIRQDDGHDRNDDVIDDVQANIRATQVQMCTILEVVQDTCPSVLPIASVPTPAQLQQQQQQTAQRDDPACIWGQLQTQSRRDVPNKQSRAQHWCTLVSQPDARGQPGVVLSCPYDGGAKMAAMGQIRPPKRVYGMDGEINVAKMYGFGGRRV